MRSTKSLLLAGTALLMLTAIAPTARAEAGSGHIVIAQAAAPTPEGEKKEGKPGEHKTPEGKPRPGPQPQHQPPKPPQAQPKPPAPPPHAQPKPPAPPPQKPAAAPPREAPKAVQPPKHPPQPNAVEHKPPEKPAAAPPKAAQQPPQPGGPRPEERRHENAGPTSPHPGPAAQPAPAPSNQKPAQAPAPQQPAAQTGPAQQPHPPANNAQTNAPSRNAPAAPVAIAPPQKPQSAQQFILQKNAKPTVTIQDVRKERHETREGNRTVITEGDRTIVKQDNRTIIRHNETQRFAVGARDVNVQRRGNETTTVIVRPDGDQIINITDADGRLLRRVRRERSGREVVIIDERSFGPRRDVFIDLPPPVIHIPRDRYIVELDRAQPDVVYEVLDAPPVERIDRVYSVAEVRYSAPLRERMPRLDLDINFDSGSWQLTPDQIDKLSVVADGLNRAINRNPREVFLIEGHTDAVGSEDDNLSLSDRRAEAVAVALTEQFNVPPENLVTQGYGEQDLKVQTQGASRANRRVSVRRITPLIDQQAAR